MDLPVGFGAGLGQGLHKGTPVNIVVKHRGFAIATAHDIVNGALILDPKFSGHEGSIIDLGEPVNAKIQRSDAGKTGRRLGAGALFGTTISIPSLRSASSIRTPSSRTDSRRRGP